MNSSPAGNDPGRAALARGRKQKTGLTAAQAIGLMLVAFVVFVGFSLLGDSRPTCDRQLSEAVKTGDLAAARAAMADNAWVNQTNMIGSTLLHTAAWRGDIPMARLLIDSGAEINHADHRGETPLHSAARGNNPAMVRLLLEAGADPEHRLLAETEQCNGTTYPAGATALSIAEQSGFDGVKEVLVQAQR